ncbi:hypothetical protein MVEN_02014600 [Mycena venus]|uniref:F-box domain-containing protein n=1 Tax=Mycena venus TaxID=2733690 RepID=A0A8H7CHK0_9AGAR|nr:hypothetical protein MVEN_02014600 [Mycena venus]
MPSFALPVLSNRHTEFQTQNILVRDQDGRLHFAPITRRAPTLPPEILAEIFIHCLPALGFVTPDPAEPPLALCAICRWWREVALSTPRLWSSLLVDFDDMPTNNTDVDLYRKWLSRARGAPLSISLKDWDEKEVLTSVDPILQTFVGLSRQWKNIEIDVGMNLARSIFPVDGDFPLLERLTVSVHASELSISFCDAPKLRQVSIPIYNPHIQVPWYQLTTLRIANISVPGCIEILRNASNLLDGTFEVAGNPPDVATSIVHHNSLRKLSLGAMINQDHNVNPMPVLSFLNIPGLKSLTLEFRNWDTTGAEDVSTFSSFVSRSSAQLDTLALSSMPATTQDLIECLKATPSLRNLKLDPAHRLVNMDRVFSQFTGDSKFLPKLQSLHFVLDPVFVTPFAVVDMLSWRWASSGITQLKFFRFAHGHNQRSVDGALKSHPEYRRLEMEGMELYVGDRSLVDTFL